MKLTQTTDTADRNRILIDVAMTDPSSASMRSPAPTA